MNETDALGSLGNLLDKGLPVDNLQKMLEVCEKVDKSDRPLVFFVLEHIFRDLLDGFSDRPLESKEYEYAVSKLKTPLIDLVGQARMKKSDRDLLRQLEDIVILYDHLYDGYSKSS
jgi:hypothetical protein